jgi:molybdopterin converting factor subunit 1
MSLTVHLFAAARDRVGAPTVALELPPSATVADLRAVLLARCPELATLLPACRIAVNHDFTDDADAIPTGAEVAVIPPVSGG